MTFSAKGFGIAAAFAGALALGTASAWAFPAAPVKSGDTTVIQVAKKSHHEVSRVESEANHKSHCWVKSDATRGFGYYKC